MRPSKLENRIPSDREEFTLDSVVADCRMPFPTQPGSKHADSTKELTRRYLTKRSGKKSPLDSIEEIRRQLGWNLIKDKGH